MRRRLTLHKETLAELVIDELAAVRGGLAITTSPFTDCLSDRLAACGTLLPPCLTYTCTR